jgi:hypothetical protein
MDFFVEQDHNNVELVMNTLEPYIIQDQVSELPTDTLNKMIAYYLKTDQAHVLERIVLHLNPANLELASILAV